MTNKQHVSLNTFQFSQEALDKRIAQARFLFLRSFASVDRFSEPLSILMPKLQKLFAAGRVLSDNHPSNTMGSLTVFLLKENIDQLLEAVDVETTEKYHADLAAEKHKQQLILEQQLYQAQVDKKAKEEATKEAKLRADAAKQAEEFFANLETTNND